MAALQTNLGFYQVLGGTIPRRSQNRDCGLLLALEKRIAADAVCDGAEDTRDAYRRSGVTGGPPGGFRT